MEGTVVTKENNSILNQEDQAEREISTFEQVASVAGQFYDRLMTAYLTGEAQLETLTEDLLDSVPGRMQPFFRKTLDKFKEELNYNHALIAGHRGEETQFLFESFLNESDIFPPDQIPEILTTLSGKFSFYEPQPGVAILETNMEGLEALYDTGVLRVDGDAVAVSSDDRKDPSFIIVRQHAREPSMLADPTVAAEKGILRHEFHHFVWNHLKRAEFVRPVAEVNETFSNGFDKFRNEMVSYTMEGANRVQGTSQEYFTYNSDDRNLIVRAHQSKSFAFIAQRLREAAGESRNAFYYASMTARNFDEFEKNVFDLIPVLGSINTKQLQVLFNVISKGEADLDLLKPRTDTDRDLRQLEKVINSKDIVKTILQEKNIHVTDEVFDQLVISQLTDTFVDQIGEFMTGWQELQRFDEDMFGGVHSADNRVWRQVLQDRTPFRLESISAMITGDIEYWKHLPLDQNMTETAKGLCNLYKTDDPEYVEFFRKMGESDPLIREALLNIKQEQLRIHLILTLSKHPEDYTEEDKEKAGAITQRVEQMFAVLG